MEIVITYDDGNDRHYQAIATSFDRAEEELGAIRRKVEGTNV